MQSVQASGGNANMHMARRAGNDEFYTRIADIEREMRFYDPHFAGARVYCNCDDPGVSNFFRHFGNSFVQLGLKRLITTCYRNTDKNLFSRGLEEHGLKLIYDGPKGGKNHTDVEDAAAVKLDGDGDFRSPECVELLRQSDIVATNPPFSLFREYIAQLMAHDKKFIVLGNFNAATYSEIFPLIKSGKIWLGVNPRGMEFDTPDPKKPVVKVNTTWYTNLSHQGRREGVHLFRPYREEDYPAYDNYDAIEVGRVNDIPADYAGVMGVPVTFLEKYNPDQFEIIGMGEDNGRGHSGGVWRGGSTRCLVSGTPKFKRIFIKRRAAA